MSESTEQPTAEASPTLSDVLAALQADVEALPDQFDQLIIRKATDHEYAYRVYQLGGDDYEGGILSLDS